MLQWRKLTVQSSLILTSAALMDKLQTVNVQFQRLCSPWAQRHLRLTRASVLCGNMEEGKRKPREEQPCSSIQRLSDFYYVSLKIKIWLHRFMECSVIIQYMHIIYIDLMRKIGIFISLNLCHFFVMGTKNVDFQGGDGMWSSEVQKCREHESGRGWISRCSLLGRISFFFQGEWTLVFYSTVVGAAML